MAEVTRATLSEALDGHWVFAKNRDGTHRAQVCVPSDSVDELWDKLVELQPDPPGPVADRELALIAHVASAFEDMGDIAVARVMRYLSDRYPPED